MKPLLKVSIQFVLAGTAAPTLFAVGGTLIQQPTAAKAKEPEKEIHGPVVRGVINRNVVPVETVAQSTSFTVPAPLPESIRQDHFFSSIQQQSPDVPDKDTTDEGSVVIVQDPRPTEVLLVEARTLLLEKPPYDVAINNLRSIILRELKTSEYAKQAYELLGYAFEKSRKYEKAKAQYSLYLRLYPEENEDRTRVRQRLMALEILSPRDKLDVLRNRKPKEGDSQTFSASVSNYVYVNKSTDSPTQVNLLSGIQASASLEHNEYELSSRVRLTSLRDFTFSKGNRTNLSTAYINFEDSLRNYGFRLGRQPSVAGAISRFDGLSARYTLNDNMKFNFAAGEPFVGLNSSTKRKFVGGEFVWTINQNWVGDFYANRGTADGLLERSALGTELHYVDNKMNLNIRGEYDTTYKTLNSISLQGIKYYNNYDLYFLYDRRRTPLPYADVALNVGELGTDHQIYNSVGEMITRSGLTTAEVYNYVSGVTPVATSAVIGINHKISEDVSISLDAEETNLTTTDEFNVSPKFDPVPVQIGQSKNYSLNFHIRNDNFGTSNNTFEAVMSQSTGGIESNYITLADSYRFGPDKRNSVAAIARYDLTRQNFGKIGTTSGIVRGIFKINKNLDLEAQYSRSYTVSPAPSLPNVNQSFYLGVRREF